MDCGQQITLAFLCGVVALPVMVVLGTEWMFRPWWLRIGAERRRMRPLPVREDRK